MPGVPGRSGKLQKPIAIHKLEGTYDKRYNGPYDAPVDQIKGMPRKPCNLSNDAEMMFEHVCEEFGKIEGVLAEIDTYQLELCCRWFSKARELAVKMETAESEESATKLERRAKAAWETFDKAAKQFGLSPAARATLRTLGQNQNASDPLAEFGIA